MKGRCSKQPYENKKDAQSKINYLISKGDVDYLRAYPCPCGRWHITKLNVRVKSYIKDSKWQ